jgi:hypothetical protein
MFTYVNPTYYKMSLRSIRRFVMCLVWLVFARRLGNPQVDMEACGKEKGLSHRESNAGCPAILYYGP